MVEVIGTGVPMEIGVLVETGVLTVEVGLITEAVGEKVKQTITPSFLYVYQWQLTLITSSL